MRTLRVLNIIQPKQTQVVRRAVSLFQSGRPAFAVDFRGASMSVLGLAFRVRSANHNNRKWEFSNSTGGYFEEVPPIPPRFNYTFTYCILRDGDFMQFYEGDYENLIMQYGEQ